MGIENVKGAAASSRASVKSPVAAVAGARPGSLGLDSFSRSRPAARDGASESNMAEIKRIAGLTLLGAVGGAVSPIALGLFGISMTLTGPAWAALIGIGAVAGLGYSLLKSKD